MTVLPTTTVADLTSGLSDTIAANAAVVVGVLALAVGVAFVMRWFHKSTHRIKA